MVNVQVREKLVAESFRGQDRSCLTLHSISDNGCPASPFARICTAVYSYVYLDDTAAGVIAGTLLSLHSIMMLVILKQGWC